MKQSQRIVKNGIAAGLGVAGSGVLQLAAFLLVARSLPVPDFGTFSFLVAFSGMLQLVADFGLSNILVRELATNKERAPELLGAARSLIWMISAAMFILMVGGLYCFEMSHDTRMYAIIMGAGTLCLYHAAGYAAMFRAFEDIEYNALGEFLHKVLVLIFLGVAIRTGSGLLGVVIAYSAANALQWLMFYFIVCWKYFRPHWRIDPVAWRRLALDALGLGGGTIVRQLSGRVDILLLTALAGVTAVGYFSVPYRIMIALNLLPVVVCMALFPVFSRLALGAVEELSLAYRRTSKFLWLISVPLATLLVAWADPLIRLSLGNQYAASIDPMRVLAIALVPTFLSAPLPYIFTALRKQKVFTVTALAGLGLRVVLNVILVPLFGPLMACATVLICETAILVTWMLLLRTEGLALPIDTSLWKPLAASGAIGAGLFFFARFPLPVMVVSGIAAAGVYLLLVIALRTFNREEIRLAREGISFLRPLLGRLTGRPAREA